MSRGRCSRTSSPGWARCARSGVWSGPGRCPAEILTKAGAEVEAVLGTDRWTAAMLDEASRLRLIALTSVGFDMVDISAATARGMLVTNTPDVLTETVADLTFALILAAARRICETERWMRAGQWQTLGVSPMGRDVHHATLGIVGLGRIGVAVAERRAGFPDAGALFRLRAARGAGAGVRLPVRQPGDVVAGIGLRAHSTSPFCRRRRG